MKETLDLPLNYVTLVFGALSIPLAFVGQLCVPALIMGVLAMVFHGWGRLRQRKNTYAAPSLRRSRLGFLLALGGSLCALAMWVLWGTGVLL